MLNMREKKTKKLKKQTLLTLTQQLNQERNNKYNLWVIPFYKFMFRIFNVDINMNTDEWKTMKTK